VLFPEKFANIVFTEPAGLSGQVSMLELIKNVIANDSKLKELREDLSRPDVVKDAKYARTNGRL